MRYLVNSPGKGRAMAKRKRKGKTRSAAQRRATAKLVAFNKRKRKGGATVKRKSTPATTRKRRRRTTITQQGGTTMAKRTRKRRASSRKRRRSTAVARYRSNPVARRRRYRRNPGIIGQIKQAAMDGVMVAAGGAAARIVSNFSPLPKTGLTGAGVDLLIAVGLGIGARKLTSADNARILTAGAMQPAIKKLVTNFIPSAGAFLGDYDGVGAYMEAGSTPRALSAYPDDNIGSYPGGMGVVEVYDQ